MSDDYAHSNKVGHVVPLWLLLGVLGTLLFLTFITVYVTNCGERPQLRKLMWQ